MDELGLDERQSSGPRAKVNRPLAELRFLVMQAEQEKEKRRLVIATLETLVGTNGEGVQDLQEFRSYRARTGASEGPEVLNS
jgi:hypothetical protein